MEYSAARICLYMLVFLQTFSLLLCTSTYLNHGLQGNLEASVRSPVKKNLLPEIQYKMRTSRSTVNENLKSSQLETLCSYHATNVLCTASQGLGDRRLQQSRVKHSISSTERLRSINRNTLNSVLTNSRHQNGGSNIESLLINDRSSTLQQKLIISQLSNYQSPLAEIELEDIIQEELQRTNHRRHSTDLSVSRIATSSTSSSPTTSRPTTTSRATNTAVETTQELPTNSRIKTRNSESLSSQSTTSRLGNQCNHSNGPFCLHGGRCIYDSRLNVSDCVCTLQYTDYRCGRRVYQSSATRVDVSGDNPLQGYGDWTRNWRLNRDHRPLRHRSRFNKIHVNL